MKEENIKENLEEGCEAAEKVSREAGQSLEERVSAITEGIGDKIEEFGTGTDDDEELEKSAYSPGVSDAEAADGAEAGDGAETAETGSQGTETGSEGADSAGEEKPAPELRYFEDDGRETFESCHFRPYIEEVSDEEAEDILNTINIYDDEAVFVEEIHIEEEEALPPLPFKQKVKNFKDKVTEKLGRWGVPDMLLLRFVAVYFIASTFYMMAERKTMTTELFHWRDFIEAFPMPKMLLSMAGSYAALTILHGIMPKKARVFDQILAIAGTMFFSCTLMWKNTNYQMCIAVTFVSIVFVAYALSKLRLKQFEKIPWWITGSLVLVVAGLVCYFVAMTTIYHNGVYGTSTFDFGIFVQMYHSLGEHLTAVTTCERDIDKSHFLIHASFIFYILAPIYKIAPYAEALLAIQAIFAMGGVIPLFLMAKRHNFKGVSLAFVCFIYIFCAGVIAPCYYDFHENCFLPTILMWLLWAMDGRKYVMFYIMAALTCIVKEDAPLYAICVAMYFFFREKGHARRWNGIIITVICGIYFAIITSWLTKYGDGEFMASTRFAHLSVDPDAGFTGIILNVLKNPGYFFSLLLTEGTLIFFLQVMIPLMFMPFFTKKISRYLLMMPFIIMNLTIGSGYGYAASIGYQYIFGPAVLLVYMSIINIEDLGLEKKRNLPVVLGCASMISSFSLVSGNISYKDQYKSDPVFAQIDELLDTVPEDACVAADVFLQPHIALRDKSYIWDANDFYYDASNPAASYIYDLNRYEYIVLQYNENGVNSIPMLEANGCTEVDKIEGRVVIYHNPNYDPNYVYEPEGY